MKLKPHHIFYIGFFVVYFLVIYFLLYHANGLNPFSVNIHYFANVIGSLLKRFLSDAASYALIFYLLYYTKALWKRIVLIILFIITFFLNGIAIVWYFVARSNFQLYHIQSYDWDLLIDYLTPPSIIFLSILFPIIAGLMVILFKIKNKRKTVWLPKQKITAAILIILAFGAPFFPIPFSTHSSLSATESLNKDFYRTVELQHSGITLLAKELKYYFSPPEPITFQLNEGEKDLIQDSHLDDQISQLLPTPPKKIVLVILESFDQKFFSYYNPELSIETTHFDKFLEQYPRVDEFYPSGVYTPFALSALFCGHPNHLQTTKNPDHECVPKLLEDAGYKNEMIKGETKYFVGGHVVHFTKFGFKNIFALEEFEVKYPDFIETHYDLYKTWGYTDNYIFNELIERLKDAKPEDKLFFTLVTVDVHFPGGRCYYEQTDGPEDQLLYSITCFDRIFNEFIENLKKENLLNEDLVILLTADQLFPGYNDIQGDEFQTSFYSRNPKIPLLMITEADIDFVAKQGSLADVGSTILDIANVDIPSYYMGKSMVSNPYTTPMGQDRKNGYMIIGDEFYFFSLDPQLKRLTDSITKENQEKQNTFYKWYYNNFYNLTETK